MIDDATLLRRYAEEKSEAAFAEFVRRHIDLVYAAALRRTGDAHRAKDVAQHVFATVARNARSLARHAMLGAWLHTATRNAALNLMISEQRRKIRERTAVSLEMAGGGGGDPGTVDWQHLRTILDATIDKLPTADRMVVVARFLEQRPFAEIGSALNVSEEAARKRVERALEKLRLLLARHGISSTSTALGMALAHEAALGAPAGVAASVAAGALSEVAKAGAFAGFIAFMTGMKSTIALGIIACAATVTALYQTHDARAAVAALDAERDALATLRRAAANLAAQARDEESTLGTARSLARDSAASAAARETATPQAAAQAVALERQKADQALQQFLAADSQLQELKREHRLQTAIRLLLPFGLSMGLTAEELEQVAAEFNRWGPVYLPIDDTHLKGMPRRLASDPRFVEAWKISDARFTVENFNMTLWEPLNATQAARLIQSIQSARPNPIPSDGYNFLGIQRTTDWAQVLVDAGDYLSPGQTNALRGFAAVGQGQALLLRAARQSQP